MQISIRLWVTGDKDLSASSFLILRDIASEFSLDNLDTCLTKAFGTFIANSKFMRPQNIEHIEFLENSIVELYSLDIQKSYQKVLMSVQQLASILRLALKTKKKVLLSHIALCICVSVMHIYKFCKRFITLYSELYLHADIFIFLWLCRPIHVIGGFFTYRCLIFQIGGFVDWQWKMLISNILQLK